MRFAWAAFVALLAPNACRGAGDVAGGAMIAAENPEIRKLLHDRSALRVELDPPLPTRIAPGDRAPIVLRARFESGEPCRFCQVSSSSSDPDVATFSSLDPCTEGRCREVLQGVAPGKAVLTIELCQTYESDCRRWRFRVKVGG